MARRNLLERPPLIERLRTALRGTAVIRGVYRWRRNRMADAFILSFPKCGRTWLRIMLGRALQQHYGLAGQELIELDQIAREHPDLPRIRFKHDDNPHFKTPSELVTIKSEYRDRKVALLVRDPRDVVVSAYFQLTRREDAYRYEGALPQFLAFPRGSIDTIIRFYNLWAQQRDQPRGFLLLRYEDLHADGADQLKKLLGFLGIEGVSEAAIQDAVAFSSFDNMRKMEASDALKSGRLRPGDPNDPESFKTRRGKVGGYRDYLTPEEADALDEKVRRELDPVYGYR